MDAFQAFQSEILTMVVFAFLIGGICGYPLGGQPVRN